jgi:hypothetical protein
MPQVRFTPLDAARPHRGLPWILLTGLLATLVVACGGDGPGGRTGGEDTDDTREVDRDLQNDGSDAVAETAEDTPDESTPDAEVGGDAADEPDQPGVEICDDGVDNDGDGLVDCDDVDDCVCEICNDLIDNDGDGLIDCQDPDCSDDENCPERCQNGVDDDADGDVDCDDSECALTSRCLEDPMPAESYVFGPMGYFHHLQYPPPGVECCFDYDDDPAFDNQLPAILGLIPDYDPQANMTGVVNNGSLAVLLEWRRFPDTFAEGGPVAFNIYRGVPVSPDPIGPDENAWAGGDGVFRVTADSFDSRGPRVRFDHAALGTDGVLTSQPNFLDLTIPIPELDLDLTLTVYAARVEMHLRLVGDDDPHLETVPQTAMGADGPVTVGGGKLGGYVMADDLLAFFNDGAALCGCAEPSASPGPLFDYGERPDPLARYVVSCNWTPLQAGDFGYTCNESDSALCPFLRQMCGFVPLLPFVLDVDANKNGINESVSVGLFFDLTGAALDEDAIEY